MSDQLSKYVVGLALKREIYNRGFNRKLFELYSDPSPSAIKDLHDNLLPSHDPSEREIAFWLQLALKQPPVRADLRDLSVKLNQMEVILLDLLWKVDPSSQRDLNDWMNYIANVPQSLNNEHGLDAKILMSLAERSSGKVSINRMKAGPKLVHTIKVLQQETLRIYELIKRLPVRLVIPEERLRIMVKLQDFIISLLRKTLPRSHGKEASEATQYLIQRLEASQGYLMRSRGGIAEAEDELKIAIKYIEERIPIIPDRDLQEWFKRLHGKIEVMTASLPKDNFSIP